MEAVVGTSLDSDRVCRGGSDGQGVGSSGDIKVAKVMVAVVVK